MTTRHPLRVENRTLYVYRTRYDFSLGMQAHRIFFRIQPPLTITRKWVVCHHKPAAFQVLADVPGLPCAGRNPLADQQMTATRTRPGTPVEVRSAHDADPPPLSLRASGIHASLPRKSHEAREGNFGTLHAIIVRTGFPGDSFLHASKHSHRSLPFVSCKAQCSRTMLAFGFGVKLKLAFAPSI